MLVDHALVNGRDIMILKTDLRTQSFILSTEISLKGLMAIQIRMPL